MKCNIKNGRIAPKKAIPEVIDLNECLYHGIGTYLETQQKLNRLRAILDSNAILSETIERLNTAALKYCHSSYLSGGICDVTTAHAFNGDDFYKFTGQYYGDANAKYLDSYNDGGTYGSPYCYGVKSSQYCGYNNSIIDNGGYYSFGSGHNSGYALYWNPIGGGFITNQTLINKAYGLRPVLKLDSSITATGGAGSIDNPYTISTRSGV